MSINPDPKQRFYTAEEYLEAEELAEFRSEYHGGEIFAMVGSTESHNVISLNIASALLGKLRGGHCRPLMQDMRVMIGSDAKFYYPDVLVVCDKPVYRNEKKTSLINPRVVFEVLYEFTASFDYGQKFQGYQQIASLTDYILVAQDQPRVEHFKRQPDGDWLLHSAAGTDATLDILSIECQLNLADIYDSVEFEAASAS